MCSIVFLVVLAERAAQDVRRWCKFVVDKDKKSPEDQEFVGMSWVFIMKL